MSHDETKSIENIKINAKTPDKITISFDHQSNTKEHGSRTHVLKSRRTYQRCHRRTALAVNGTLRFTERAEYFIDGVHEESIAHGPLDDIPLGPGESLVDRVVRDLIEDFEEDVTGPLVLALRAHPCTCPSCR